MRRRFNQDLLPAGWKPKRFSKIFCPISFGAWVKMTQEKYDVNTVRMEWAGFNPGTLTRWRQGKQKRKPNYSMIVKFCECIQKESTQKNILEKLIIEAEQNMYEQ